MELLEFQSTHAKGHDAHVRQGLTPKFGETVGVNAVHRSNKGDVVAVVNDFGT